MIGALITFVIYLIVLGIIMWLLLYIIDTVPMGEPFHTVARVVVIVVACLILILLLLQLVGGVGGVPHLNLR